MVLTRKEEAPLCIRTALLEVYASRTSEGRVKHGGVLGVADHSLT